MFTKIGKKIKKFFICLGSFVGNFFKAIGRWLKRRIVKLGDKIGNWVISLRNEQIEILEKTIGVLVDENAKRSNELQEAAELVLDSEVELNKLAYENKILEDLAYSKMTQTLEMRHELALFIKEKELEAKINAKD